MGWYAIKINQIYYIQVVNIVLVKESKKLQVKNFFKVKAKKFLDF